MVMADTAIFFSSTALTLPCVWCIPGVQFAWVIWGELQLYWAVEKVVCSFFFFFFVKLNDQLEKKTFFDSVSK